MSWQSKRSRKSEVHSGGKILSTLSLPGVRIF